MILHMLQLGVISSFGSGGNSLFYFVLHLFMHYTCGILYIDGFMLEGYV